QFQLAVVRVTEDGEPDSSFSTVPSDGVRIVDIPGSNFDDAFAVKVLPNGNVLVGGVDENGALLFELDSEGNLVPGFGEGGIVVDDLGSAPFPSGEILDLKLLPDGKILAAGDAVPSAEDEEGVVARFTPEGELDPTFGEGGVFHDNPTSDRDELDALEVDGK